MACSLFQLVLKRTSAILDAGLHPAQDASARSPDLLLLQGILLLLHSGDQILQGGGVGGGGYPAALPRLEPVVQGRQAILQWWPEGTTTMWAERLTSIPANHRLADGARVATSWCDWTLPSG